MGRSTELAYRLSGAEVLTALCQRLADRDQGFDCGPSVTKEGRNRR
jgi:hypothetical protein